MNSKQIGIEQLFGRLYPANSRSSGVERSSGYETCAFADALAHEINNPLAVAMMEVSSSEPLGVDLPVLRVALSRIHAVIGELSLVSSLRNHWSDWLTLSQAIAIVLRTLGDWATRVDLDLDVSDVALRLEGLKLCHLLHAVLVSHLDADADSRVRIRCEPGNRQLTLAFVGGGRSGRARASPLAILLGEVNLPTRAEVLAETMAHSVGVFCTRSEVPVPTTVLELPCSQISTVIRRA